MVRLRLTSTGFDREKTENEVQQSFETLQSLVKDHMVTNEDEPIEKTKEAYCWQRQNHFTAESCSGGYIAHLLTSIPGSSKFYDGSVVSYSYKAKEDLLQVHRETLESVGAVSEEVVLQMLKALKEYQGRLCDRRFGYNGAGRRYARQTGWHRLGSGGQ